MAEITSRSDPAEFMNDPDKLGKFIERLRAAGIKNFSHPCGLILSFENQQPALKTETRW